MAETKLSAVVATNPTPALEDLLHTVDDPSGTPTSAQTTVGELMTTTGLVHTALADANTSLVVGAMHTGSLAAWATAHRTYTLPAVAAVGAKCGVCITGNAGAYDLVITAAAGHTLNGVAGGTEWSRLLLLGEVVIFRCVVADTTWIVEYDGRLPCRALLVISTPPSGEAAATYTIPTDAGGTWTEIYDDGNAMNPGTGVYTIRRGGRYRITAHAGAQTSLADGQYYSARVTSSGNIAGVNAHVVVGNSGTPQVEASRVTIQTAGTTLQYEYRSSAGSKGASAVSYFQVEECLSVKSEL